MFVRCDLCFSVIHNLLRVCMFVQSKLVIKIPIDQSNIYEPVHDKTCISDKKYFLSFLYFLKYHPFTFIMIPELAK